METMQGAIKNGRNVWDPINMPGTEFERRIARVREAMKEEALDLLLVYGFGLNRYADPAYLTNFIIRLPRGTLMALPREGEPAIIFEGGSRGIPSLKKTVHGAELVAAADNAKDCVKYLKARNLIPCRVGLIGVSEMMPYPQFKLLTESLAGSEVKGAGPVIRDMRLLKSERELDQIRRAARIAGDILAAVPVLAFPGLVERTIEACLFREARYERAEDVRILFGRQRAEGWYLGYPGETALGRTERVTLFLAIEFERYWAEAVRTFSVDGLRLVPAGGSLDEFFLRAASSVKAGAKCSDAYAQVVGEARKLGIDLVPDYGLGQGIGLAPHEAPEIAEGDATVLKPGMSLSLRLVAREKTGGCLMTGNTLLVTDGPAKILT